MIHIFPLYLQGYNGAEKPVLHIKVWVAERYDCLRGPEERLLNELQFLISLR